VTGDPSPYYRAVSQADQDLENALSRVRTEEDAGRLTVLDAALERMRLLEGHLAQCQALRRDYLGSQSGGTAAAGRGPA
jgi:hypothetical protein